MALPLRLVSFPVFQATLGWRKLEVIQNKVCNNGIKVCILLCKVTWIWHIVPCTYNNVNIVYNTYSMFVVFICTWSLEATSHILRDEYLYQFVSKKIPKAGHQETCADKKITELSILHKKWVNLFLCQMYQKNPNTYFPWRYKKFLLSLCNRLKCYRYPLKPSVLTSLYIVPLYVRVWTSAERTDLVYQKD